MLSKSFLVSAVVLALGLQVNAHAGVTPALGVTGTFARSNVQRPSTAKPCGNAALTAIDTSTPVNAAADGTMTMTIKNFDGGKDGSRAIKSLTIDSTGTGKSFKAAAASAVTKNGDAAPPSAGSQQITVKMPAGTKCTGGKSGNLCLMSMTTDGGFGNCVVVKQGGAVAGNSTSAPTGAVAAAGGAKAASGEMMAAVTPAKTTDASGKMMAKGAAAGKMENDTSAKKSGEMMAKGASNKTEDAKKSGEMMAKGASDKAEDAKKSGKMMAKGASDKAEDAKKSGKMMAKGASDKAEDAKKSGKMMAKGASNKAEDAKKSGKMMAKGASDKAKDASNKMTAKKTGAKSDSRAVGTRAARAYLEAPIAEME